MYDNLNIALIFITGRYAEARSLIGESGAVVQWNEDPGPVASSNAKEVRARVSSISENVSNVEDWFEPSRRIVMPRVNISRMEGISLLLFIFGLRASAIGDRIRMALASGPNETEKYRRQETELLENAGELSLRGFHS